MRRLSKSERCDRCGGMVQGAGPNPLERHQREDCPSPVPKHKAEKSIDEMNITISPRKPRRAR